MQRIEAAPSLGNPRGSLASVVSFLRILRAEFVKQHRNYFQSKLIYFSMLIWPALSFTAAYYMYRPFVASPELASRLVAGGDPRAVALFILTGYLGYTFFWSLVQSAWQFSWERFHGTLECLFLSPANRLGFILGNGLAALVESVWLFFVFAVGVLSMLGGLGGKPLYAYPLALLALALPAVGWGTLLNSVFIFSRDSGFLYTILDEPMGFFAGVRVPTSVFPLWAKFIGFLFPLTFSLRVVRGQLLEGASLRSGLMGVAGLALLSLGLLLLSALLVRQGEVHAKRTGSLTLF